MTTASARPAPAAPVAGAPVTFPQIIARVHAGELTPVQALTLENVTEHFLLNAYIGTDEEMDAYVSRGPVSAEVLDRMVTLARMGGPYATRRPVSATLASLLRSRPDLTDEHLSGITDQISSMLGPSSFLRGESGQVTEAVAALVSHARFTQAHLGLMLDRRLAERSGRRTLCEALLHAGHPAGAGLVLAEKFAAKPGPLRTAWVLNLTAMVHRAGAGTDPASFVRLIAELAPSWPGTLDELLTTATQSLHAA